jgi:RecA/RadA recombinase
MKLKLRSDVVQKAAESVIGARPKIKLGSVGESQTSALPLDHEELVPTGSTLLNLALSDWPYGGYGLGRLVNLVGDSSSGKSLTALTCLAEMSCFLRFDKYRFIYDEPEAALAFNLPHLFSRDIADRIETDIVSNTIQDFYANLLKAIKKGEPFVYILDSLDSVSSIEELKRADKIAEDEGDKGSYKMEKQKLISEILRVTCREIKGKEALVIIVSQTRDNVGFGFNPKTRSGGSALKFYASHEIWLSIKEKIKRSEREIGVGTEAKVSKNKLTGKVRKVPLSIYYDYGIDDIAENIDFLVDEGRWKKIKGTIEAKDFNFSGTKQSIIAHIEGRALSKELQRIVGEVWHKIEDGLKMDRKPKYREE